MLSSVGFFFFLYPFFFVSMLLLRPSKGFLVTHFFSLGVCRFCEKFFEFLAKVEWDFRKKLDLVHSHAKMIVQRKKEKRVGGCTRIINSIIDTMLIFCDKFFVILCLLSTKTPSVHMCWDHLKPFFSVQIFFRAQKNQHLCRRLSWWFTCTSFFFFELFLLSIFEMQFFCKILEVRDFRKKLHFAQFFSPREHVTFDMNTCHSVCASFAPKRRKIVETPHFLKVRGVFMWHVSKTKFISMPAKGTP